MMWMVIILLVMMTVWKLLASDHIFACGWSDEACLVPPLLQFIKLVTGSAVDRLCRGYICLPSLVAACWLTASCYKYSDTVKTRPEAQFLEDLCILFFFQKITWIRVTDKSTENVTSSSSDASKKKTDIPNENKSWLHSKDGVLFIQAILNVQLSKIET